ncbi:MAG: beta-propeller domain-containing protein, partial [Clostridia bacterium]|nr:beta-propeller domain-containing protein [Clostridia bacterium]
MMKKAKKLLNEKLQVKTPESLSTENIMANIENSKADIIEMPKKKHTAKRLVPIVASLLLVVGIVGMYMNLNQKNEPSANNSDVTEVMRYQSYDKVYEKFDTLHKAAKKNNIYNTFSDIFDGVAQNDAASDMIADGAMPESAIEGEIGSVQVQDDTATGTNSSTSANKNYGTTNTQEKDVDEGDIIKTDGNYLYIADSDSNRIRIIDVTSDKMSAISEIKLDDTNLICEIYINSDKLVIVGNLREENEENKLNEVTADYAYGTYGCYVEYANDTFVKVYDISDRNAPKLVTEFSQQGTYDNSRMIGARLYTISEYNVNVYSDDYREECIPTVTINDVCKEIPADGISIIEDSQSSTYAVITTLEIKEDSVPESEAILGECNHLYATSKSLFLAETSGDELQTITKIYKFDYTDAGVEYK